MFFIPLIIDAIKYTFFCVYIVLFTEIANSIYCLTIGCIVTLAITEEHLIDDIIGMPAGNDIPRIENSQTWTDTLQKMLS